MSAHLKGAHAKGDRFEWARWAISAAVVLFAHASAAAFIVTMADPLAPGTPMAAIVVDLAPMAAAPEDAQPDMAPGPVSRQVDAPPEVKPDDTVEDKPVEDKSTETVEQTTEVQPAEVQVAKLEPVEEKIEQPVEPPPQEQPLVEQAPPAPQPEVTATLPVMKKPPPPPRKKKAARPMQLASAPSPSPNRDERAVAPSQGLPSPASRQAVANWNSAINAALERAKRYPSDSKSRNEQGTAVVMFTIDRSGHVLSNRLARSSGYPALDQETLATVARASLPPAPAEHAGSRFSFSVPIRFNIR